MKTMLTMLALAACACAAAAETPAVDLTVGGDVRVRGYALENMWDADDADDADRWSLMRHRTRVFVRAVLERGVTAYVRLANQHWGEGVTGAEDRNEVDNVSDKLFVDAAYVDVVGLFGAPVDLRVGRQALIYGDGFVLFDGQSQTASTSVYMDGVRARWTVAPGVTCDLIHVMDEERARADVADDDLTLQGVYLARKGGHAQDLYVLRRVDQALDKDVRTFGLRLAGSGPAGLDYAGEAALQRGDHDAATDHEAWGVKSELGWRSDGLPGRPRLFAGWTGLSGDDPATVEHERWDVTYGGWPQYGDLLAWVYLNIPGTALGGFDPGYVEGGSVPGEVVYGNLMMPAVGLELTPASDTTLSLSVSTLSVEHFAGTSDEIGVLWQGSLRHRYSRNLGFALYGAVLDPGAAFGPDADPITEVFWETNLSF